VSQYALWLDTTLPGMSMSILRCSHDHWEMVCEFHEKKVGATAQINKIFEDLIQRSGISVDQIDHLIMGIGPGSFTGIKIGMAWALGFAAGFGTTQISLMPDESTLNPSGIDVEKRGNSGDRSLRIMGVSALEMASLGIECLNRANLGNSEKSLSKKAPLNILLKVTSSHGFLLRLDVDSVFSLDYPRERPFRVEDLPSILNQGVIHLACPWPEVSAILEGREVHQHDSLRALAQDGLVEFLNQKKMQWEEAFPSPRYLKLSTAEEKLLMNDKGEQLG